MDPVTLGLACLVTPGQQARQAVLLARSLRAFGGEGAACPLWALVPGGAESLSAAERQALLDLDVQLAGFSLPEDAAAFPFGAKVHAAGAAEARVGQTVEWLAWLDTDALVLGPLDALRPDPEQSLGCRPVDHTLIGSRWDAPCDAFWAAIYAHCGVPEDHLFPMLTSVDQRHLRPYFNAGLLVVRPTAGLLQAWRAAFQRLFRHADFVPFCDHALYKVFFHQAVLAGTLLAALPPSAIELLPRAVNYPLHMHASMPPEFRAARLEGLITARYDTLFDDPEWRRHFPVDEPRRDWLAAQAALLADASAPPK